jgi:hypothetical protein
MKKVLMGSAFLAVIGIGITATQLSCSKTTAQSTSYTLPPATTSTLGGVIVGSGLTVSSNGTLSANSTSGGLTQLNKLIYYKGYEIWTANYDGTSNSKVNITLPSGIGMAYSSELTLSPNGQKIFFTAGPGANGTTVSGDLYSCNIDGSGVTKVLDKGTGDIRNVTAH